MTLRWLHTFTISITAGPTSSGSSLHATPFIVRRSHTEQLLVNDCLYRLVSTIHCLHFCFRCLILFGRSVAPSIKSISAATKHWLLWFESIIFTRRIIWVARNNNTLTHSLTLSFTVPVGDDVFDLFNIIRHEWHSLVRLFFDIVPKRIATRCFVAHLISAQCSKTVLT